MVHYLKATSFVVLVICCMFPWSMQLQPQGKWSKPPCFEPPTHRCVDGRSCVFVCQYNGIRTYRAYCVIPANAQDKYMCCCPP
ncbi:unnamed protein product [Miscanthus lutarioriparius]|uniref:Secreted protein n=1 Tax=Miscanthus lutarioriparius TaxID=422564 RepID=A0A811SGT0_9POAL|nr:unnamed protein product [Miscanthus lutarioriparius]